MFGEEKVLFNADSHILYVNGEYRGDDEIGKLMHDFSCTNPDDMNYDILAKKARYFKQDEKGVATMSKILEDMRNKTTKDIVRRLLKLGKIKVEEISECFPELSADDIKELEIEVMQLA